MSAATVIPLQRDPNKKAWGLKRGSNRIKDTQIVKEQRALDLRLAGNNYYEIGKALGVTHVCAWKWVQAGIARAEKTTPEKALALRKIECGKLDKLERLTWREIERDKIKQRKFNAWLVDRIIRICESRRKLLGLDAAVKVSGDPDGEPIRLELSRADVKL